MRSPTIAERISYDPRDSYSKDQFLHKENPKCSLGYDCALPVLIAASGLHYVQFAISRPLARGELPYLNVGAALTCDGGTANRFTSGKRAQTLSIRKDKLMRRKQIISVFLAAAVMAMNAAPASAQSVGGSQSERSGGDTQTPLPPNSPSSGKSDASKTGKSPSKPSGKAQGNKDTSVGGSQSERSGGDTQTPLSPKSGSSGTSEEGKSAKSKSASKKATGSKDTSVGGSQSERSGGDTQTPLPPESPSSGKGSTK